MQLNGMTAGPNAFLLDKPQDNRSIRSFEEKKFKTGNLETKKKKHNKKKIKPKKNYKKQISS